ncbi:MAG: DUF4230 domain-containing protein [Lachnospiraceae bacterium]|nr:DUF4230 domain-containing protein [Lachnospiraceae bacterium]
MKRQSYIFMSAVLLIASAFILIFSGARSTDEDAKISLIEEGVDIGNTDDIEFEYGSRYKFVDRILGEAEEKQKLIVSEQSQTVTVLVENDFLSYLNLTSDITSKSVDFVYTATGKFTVDLSKLNEKRIVDDKDKKTLTIYIDEPILDSISPEKMQLKNEKNGVFALGKVKLNMEKFIELETDLQESIKEKFEEEENLKTIREMALESVKETYEPIVEQIDDDYELIIEYVP